MTDLRVVLKRGFLTALGDAADDVVVFDVVRVVSLNIGGKPVKRALESFLGGRVHHARVLGNGQSLWASVCYDSVSYLRCIIWNPADESDLASVMVCQQAITHFPRTMLLCVMHVAGNIVPLSLPSSLVFQVIDSISSTNALVTPPVLALGVEQLLTEVGVVVGRGRLLDNNLFPVVRDLVDDPFGRLAQLQVVEGCDAVGGDLNSVGIALSDSPSDMVRCLLTAERVMMVVSGERVDFDFIVGVMVKGHTLIVPAQSICQYFPSTPQLSKTHHDRRFASVI